MQPIPLPKQRDLSWWTDVLFLSLVLGALFFILLGVRPLFVPDEGRYAEIAREMVKSGDYVTPYLNGIKYFEKPILFYWLGAAAIKLGGLHLWALRSINALLGLVGCLFTYFISRTLYNRTTALLSALILATTTLYFVMAHMISLDLPVTVFLTASLYCFLLGTSGSEEKTSRWYLWGASVAAACAVLTKGLIGIVFPAVIIATWMALLNKWSLIKRLYLPSCLLIFLLITVPWHVVVGLRNPGFFYFYFINQHFLRYTTLKIGHYQPIWYFFPTLVIGFFPWIVWLPQAIKQALPSSWAQRDKHPIELFLLLWAVLIFVFFSFSKSKLMPYILPIFPPLAVLTANYLQTALQQLRWDALKRGMKKGQLCLLPMALTIAIVLVLLPYHASLPYPHIAKIYLFWAGGVLVLGMLLALVYAQLNRAGPAIYITAGTAGLVLLIFLGAMPALDSRSIVSLAALVKAKMKPDDEIIAYNQYFQDLPFYLQQRITVLNWRNELRFGTEHQDAHDWMIDTNTFLQRWTSKKRVFAFMGTDEYQQSQNDFAHLPHYLIGKTVNYVVISNLPS